MCIVFVVVVLLTLASVLPMITGGSQNVELNPSLVLLGGGSKWAASNGSSALFVNWKDNWVAHHLTDGASWPWAPMSRIESRTFSVFQSLNQSGFEVRSVGDIPQNLSNYDLVVVQAYWAIEPQHAPLFRDYIFNGGGVVILKGAPCYFTVYCRDNFPYRLDGDDLTPIQEWFGAQYYVNTGGDAHVTVENPFDTALLAGDTLVEGRPHDNAAVTSLTNSTQVIARWETGPTLAFTHEYGQGRVYYQAAYEDIPTPPTDMDPLTDLISPSDDSWVVEELIRNGSWVNASDWILGNLTYLGVSSCVPDGRDRRTFLKFPLSSISSTEDIVSVRLFLFENGLESELPGPGLSAVGNVEARAVENDSWTEMNITWNNQPQHGNVADTVYVEFNATRWISWDVTSLVLNELAGDKVLSICLKAENENHGDTYRYSYYWSKEHDDLNPHLLVTKRVQHDLTVALDAPSTLELGDSSRLDVTVTNVGMSNETEVDLFLLVDGAIIDSATIPELPTGSSCTLNYLWTPTVEKNYNVTAYAPPVSGENVTANNIATKVVNVWVSAPGCEVNVDPGTTTAAVGETFVINVTVTDVANLFGFEYKLFWDPTLIDLTTYATYVPPGWEPPLGFPVKDDSSVPGRHLYAYACLTGAPFTGDLVLATYTFAVLSQGSCALDIQESKLVDTTATLVPHSAEDGYVTCVNTYLEGDLNQDGIVDIVDVVVVGLAFGSEPGDDNWDPRADVANTFGLIDIVDVVFVAIHFGETL